jgi:membrane-bound lytic murein transglycosylase B
VIALDRHQPENKENFWEYIDKRITPRRIERGRELLTTHSKLLDAIEQQYGIAPRFLIAFWGLETNFGDYTGTFPVIGSLVTLAYDERRGAFFRAELLAALRILDEGHISAADLNGSWAGAMGQLQFLPTVFLRHAVDADGDGRRDIWQSLPDIFASAANYLMQSGWKRGSTWGSQVTAPVERDSLVGHERRSRPLHYWKALKVDLGQLNDYPAEESAILIMPAGQPGPAFLVLDNFETIRRWNRSDLYGLSVGHFADRLVGGGTLLR